MTQTNPHPLTSGPEAVVALYDNCVIRYSSGALSGGPRDVLLNSPFCYIRRHGSAFAHIFILPAAVPSLPSRPPPDSTSSRIRERQWGRCRKATWERVTKQVKNGAFALRILPSVSV